MDEIVRKISATVEPIYRGSQFYKRTIWVHATRTSDFALEFAARTGAIKFVTRVGGLLHDLGAAKFGRENHHITGVSEAAAVLFDCGCSTQFIGPILECIFCHRGSQDIPLPTLEAECVAAADALDHFRYIREVWDAHVLDLQVPVMNAYQEILGKLERDWAKTHPKVKALLGNAYVEAQQELLRIASANRAIRRRHKQKAIA